MHRYLRAVGFSGIQKREEFEALSKFTSECYQTEETAVTEEGEDFPNGEKNSRNKWDFWFGAYTMKMMSFK